MTDELEKEKAKQRLALQKKYSVRITIAKQGRELFLAKDYLGAVKKYNEYLSILAEVKEVEDIYSLEPRMFDNKRDITEMLLISQLYWDLAKTYELTPKLQSSFHRALGQFVKFTVNQPYQVLNAEVLRKHIKRHKLSPLIRNFEQAYSQIYVQSKKCFIATECFGDIHWVTQTLRNFKNSWLSNRPGMEITRLYYLASPKWIESYRQHQGVRLITTVLIKPSLFVLAGVYKILCSLSPK